MPRPADQLPLVTRHNGVDVYAPWCPDCESDDATFWLHLPSAADTGAAEGWCERCSGDYYAEDDDDWFGGSFCVGREEAHQAREPERLAARLAELQAECRRAS